MRLFTYFIVLVFVLTGHSFAQIAVNSTDVVDGKIFKESACRKKGGNDKSPQISITNIPSGAKSISIIMDDPDAMKPAGKIWVHWNVFNIPVDSETLVLDRGAKPAGIIGKGHSGGGYKGMCPPDGKHEYRIAVYAQKEDVKAKATGFSTVKYTLERFEKDFGSAIIQKSVLAGTFQ